MSIGTIAVATDFSARADRAVDRAKQLHADRGGRILCVHASNLAVDEAPDLAALKTKMHLSTGLAEVAGSVEYAFPAGSPTAAIAQLCGKEDVGLLVIGPARYNTLGDFFLGTAVDYVLRNVSNPVLVVKNRAHAPYGQIVAGTDFSPGSAHAIITAARMFPDAKIHIVHSWHVPFQAWNKDQYVADETECAHQEDMDRFMAELVSREPSLANATSDLVRGGAFDAIKKGLELDPSALVVLGSHGTSGFKQAALGSVTSDLLRFLEADTLVVNAKAAQD